MEIQKCSSCKDDLDREEVESPRHDKDGTVLCDECFENKYTHRCPICEELFDEDLEAKIAPKYLLILNEVSKYVGVAGGLYEIVEYPFYRDGITEMSIIKGTVHWLCHIPTDTDMEVDTSTIYYICDGCAVALVKKTDVSHTMRWT